MSSNIRSKMFADSVISISSIMRICGFQVELIQATFEPFMNTHLNDMYCWTQISVLKKVTKIHFYQYSSMLPHSSTNSEEIRRRIYLNFIFDTFWYLPNGSGPEPRCNDSMIDWTAKIHYFFHSKTFELSPKLLYK